MTLAPLVLAFVHFYSLRFKPYRKNSPLHLYISARLAALRSQFQVQVFWALFLYLKNNQTAMLCSYKWRYTHSTSCVYLLYTNYWMSGSLRRKLSICYTKEHGFTIHIKKHPFIFSFQLVNCIDQNKRKVKYPVNISYEFECFLFYYLPVKMDCHINMENRETLRPSFLQFGIYWAKIKENICFIVEMTV